ncbi:uncharacterized protein LOC114386044 [Glycine soja]|uniref:uncharacterized protein LOC114386044 n=1 Tax=Glycine soja TaxID=3848 RepID=UPI00103FBFC7|nr:uncharacterized protein LOC114386044 [Glycine soja]
MDHAYDEVHEQPEEAAADDVLTNAEDFPGEPHNTSVLQDYVYHVVTKVWNGEERLELKLFSQGRKAEKFGRPAPEIEDLVAATGLSPLITCSLNTSDQGLMSAFMERWHKETSAFHTFESLHVDDTVLLLVELLEVSVEEAQVETCWIYEHFPSVGCVVAADDYDERKPRAYRWKSRKALLVSMYHKRLDRLTSDVVCWIPYDHSSAPAAPSLSIEDIDDRWIQFSEYIAPPPVQHHDTFVEPDVTQHPVVTMAMNEASEDAHVDEACQAIAERLERLLNLRIVTEGTKTYNVMEDCLRIARGVTVDRNVYVRLQRRWHIEVT